MKRKNILSFLCLAIFAGFLCACGANDLTGDPTGTGDDIDDIIPSINPHLDNKAPTAVINVYPAEVMYGQKITLDGTGSFDADGDAITYYKWTKSGSVAVLEGGNNSVATITAPAAKTTLKFTLTVADEHGRLSAPAEVVVEVKDFPPPSTNVIVVSSAVGKDSNVGSFVSPVQSINKAIALATEKGFTDVYVMEGTYSETVQFKNGINLTGGIVSFGTDGTPIFSTAADKTTVLDKVMASGVEGVTISNFRITGSMVLDDSSNINISGNSFEGSCTDIEISSSSAITVTKNHFLNSGNCTKYIAIDISDSDGTKITDSNYFSIRMNGEDEIIVINSQGGELAEISGSTISKNGTATGEDTLFTGVMINGTDSAVIEGNLVSLAGGKAATGVAINCTDSAISTVVEGNDVALWSAANDLAGVRATCNQPNSTFDVLRNRVYLAPASSSVSTVKGVAVSTLLRPVKLTVTNNIIALPVVASDTSSKTAIDLAKVGESSTINILFNTTYLTGNQGELHSVHSDVGGVQISSLGNIFMVYGSNDNNSVFSLKGECFAKYCIKDLVGNLINTGFFNKDVPLTYYNDTGVLGGMEYANQCQTAPTTPACVSGLTSRKGNVLQDLKPTYFDQEDWSLLQAYQNYAVDNGPEFTGTALDINENPRDSEPDIGAVEY